MATLNSNPIVATTSTSSLAAAAAAAAPLVRGVREPMTADEVFDLIRHVRDPEHEALTLEQLRVATSENITVDDDDDACGSSLVSVRFTPTIPHCSMATLIGLCISVKLMRSLPPRIKLSVAITPGTHASEDDINKQLADKERVAAALENPHLLKVVNKCVANSDAPMPVR